MLMSSRMWTVTFLRLKEGPVSLTSLRLKVSPANSRKNTRNTTMVAWVTKPIRLIEPASTQSMILMLLLPGGGAATLRGVARRSSTPTLAVARSICSAAACTWAIVLGVPSLALRMTLVTFWVRRGRSSMILKNSPCTRCSTPASKARMMTVTRVAPMARGTLQRSSQRTTGLSV